ncbi:flagellar brake protein [Xanthomonas oryzae pv. oryzae]|nr:pilus assembly protein PilZ [Xanthomonas oryzae pv. oryzae]AUI94140.1 pilus assembly protein PilZ [Xanthomonas oryzae pv. oryzae]AUI97810.1 pilus assembly protein PilZ [Xanthomonas oryzae pv. oryzae]AUJ01486.1 pilus assembly protein PilZ [Xanthomonas oryzae pv. oryzae]AUJ05162.1 pilus assembly protein PilZ [Xanthomonas oryzae pv. oryzae]
MLVPMSQGDTSELDHNADHLAEGDERYRLGNKRQIRGLLRQLLDQRAIVTMHVAGRDLAVPTAVLEVGEDDDCVILDGSHNNASNRAIEGAKYLLCYAQLERVNIRFRLEKAERIERNIHAAFRADLPDAVYHMQRRESYRLETPITDSPICTIRQEAEQGEALNLQLRVIDISSGGLAVSLTDGMPLLEPQRTYRNCILQLPDTAPITLPLTVCSHYKQTLPNGSEGFRVGMHFSDLPRGADETIQRYIFRVDRQRNARKSGMF